MKNPSGVEIKPLRECLSFTTPEYARHHYYEILWFTSDSNTCQRIDHQKHSVCGNSVFLIGKGQTHEMKNPAEGYSILLALPFFQYGDNSRLRIIFNPFVNEAIKIDSTTAKSLKGIIDMAIAEISQTNSQPVIYSLIAAFLYKISLFAPEMRVGSESSPRLENLYILIEKHYRSERKAEFYADQVGLTTKRLNEILKNKVGLTLTQLLHKVVTGEAKKQIAKGNKTIKEVSFDLGFSEQAYFSRFFKKQTGISPEQFSKISREAL